MFQRTGQPIKESGCGSVKEEKIEEGASKLFLLQSFVSPEKQKLRPCPKGDFVDNYNGDPSRVKQQLQLVSATSIDTYQTSDYVLAVQQVIMKSD